MYLHEYISAYKAEPNVMKSVKDNVKVQVWGEVCHSTWEYVDVDVWVNIQNHIRSVVRESIDWSVRNYIYEDVILEGINEIFKG